MHRRLERADGGNGYVETDPTGRYGRFNEVLGKGATKTVYRAFDEQRGMEVAWNQAKLNDVLRSPEELERIYSEVHILSTLNHGSIIKYYASWIDPPSRTINFITEMFTSGTLREYRQKYKQVDTRAVKNWARQILHGLVYLHSHDPPVIHRDLKCDNIFVNGHLGQVKIGDLGLAAILRGSQAAHSVIGTPEFMAPELYEEEYNELVDVYSFGMCVLEMLTSEYPYSECSNPAQIYKKVTSGKKPRAFYRIQDPEGQLFVGKCLEVASKRLPAKEILVDPFLRLDDDESESQSTDLVFGNSVGKSEVKTSYLGVRPLSGVGDRKPIGTMDMTITGKRNPDDDTIFLKVQIADRDGRVRNIHFPFDIITDTPIDVATEMVKELEITDRDPIEIAVVIEDEISALVPHSKDWSQEHNDYPDDDVGSGPFHAASSNSSSQVSLIGLLSEHGVSHCPPDDEIDWLQGNWIAGEGTSSPSSVYSGHHPSWQCNSSHEEDSEFCTGGRESDQQALMNSIKSSSRFCPETPRNCHSGMPGSHQHSKHTRTAGNRGLMKIRSFVDVQRQLHQRSLVEEVKKLRLFKTVGAIESIGFQAPRNSAGRVWSPGSTSRGAAAVVGEGKKQGFTWGRS